MLRFKAPPHRLPIPGGQAGRVRLRFGPWGSVLLAGLLLAVGSAGVVGAENGKSAAADPRTLREAAFGAPCEGTPVPPFALKAPHDAAFAQYTAARCAAAAGRLTEAAEGFRAGLGGEAALTPLWRWALLQTQVLAGAHDEALQTLEALLTGEPGDLLTERARTLVTMLALEPGLAPQERRTDYLLTYLEHVTPGAEDYPLLYGLWKTAGQAPGTPLDSSLALLMWRNPPDQATARQWAAYLAGKEGTLRPTVADHLARAERLFSQGSFDLLIAELEDPGLPLDNEAYAKALGRLYFRALIRAKQLQRAAVQVNTASVARRFAFDERQQLIWAIRIQLRRRNIGPAMKYMEDLERRNPKDEELPAVILELLKYNQGRGDTPTVLHWLEALATRFPNAAETSDAYWQVAWDAVERRAYDEAMALLDQAIRASAAFHPVDQARLHYWRGRLLMRQGQQEAGEAVWREMEERWPYGYYTEMAQWMRSGEHIALDHGTDGRVPEPEPGPPPKFEALWAEPGFAEGILLLALDEPDLATERLKGVLSGRLSPEAVREAGMLFRFAQRHYLQLRLVDNQELGTLRSSKVERTDLWLRAYPRPHWEMLRGLAEERGIDPYFVLAIMREESRFFTSANSTAGARGLMQLMPATARMVAKHNGMDYDESLLHTPEFNVPLGAIYLKRVLGRFKNNLFYGAAAYNAGPGNVKRWLQRYGQLPLDEFVERIPFGETQRYVKRVFLSYRIYTRLYR